MYPWYAGYVEDFQLHTDDIAGVQYLYGMCLVLLCTYPHPPVCRMASTLIGALVSVPLPTLPSHWAHLMLFCVRFGRCLPSLLVGQMNEFPHVSAQLQAFLLPPPPRLSSRNLDRQGGQRSAQCVRPVAVFQSARLFTHSPNCRILHVCHRFVQVQSFHIFPTDFRFCSALLLSVCRTDFLSFVQTFLTKVWFFPETSWKFCSLISRNICCFVFSKCDEERKFISELFKRRFSLQLKRKNVKGDNFHFRVFLM